MLVGHRLFHKLDLDSNGSLSHAELRALIIGIQIDEIDLDTDDAVDKIMIEFDTSQNSSIEEDEFIVGLTKWIDEAKRSVANSGAYSKKFMHEFHMVSCFFHFCQKVLWLTSMQFGWIIVDF